MQRLAFLIPLVGVVAARVALSVSRARYYRTRKPKHTPTPRPRPARALSDRERAQVLATLDSEAFMDLAPAQVYARLLEDGEYLCSTRTMYRVLAAAGQVRERRAQRRHPAYTKPQLVATAPNQVWSWDTTKLPGPTKGTYYTLYVVLDIFSRYIVGWQVTACITAAPTTSSSHGSVCSTTRIAVTRSASSTASRRRKRHRPRRGSTHQLRSRPRPGIAVSSREALLGKFTRQLSQTR